MRKTLLLSLLVLGLFVAPSYAVLIDNLNFNLNPASGSTNVVTLSATVYNSHGSDSDTKTSSASGNVYLDLDYTFNSADPQHPVLNALQFVGGSFDLTNVSLSVDIYTGWDGFLDLRPDVVTGTAVSNGLGGTFSTNSGTLSPVASNGTFDASLHTATLNEGTIDISAYGFSVYEMDFASDPNGGSPEGTATLTTSCVGISGNTYTYQAVLQMPVAISESGSQSADVGIGTVDANYDITAEGTFVATSITFQQTILPPNTPPVANNDSYTVHVSDVLSVTAPGVLGNDSDANGDSLTAIKVSNPTDGDLTFNSNGSFTYDPDTYFRGTDTFTYKANDGTDNSSPATVTIEVYNNAPTVVDDAYTLDQDGFMSVTGALGVLKNDTDIDGDNFSAFVQDNVDNGMLSMNMDGSFVYMPLAGFSGTDTFTYYATDGWDSSDLATVTFTVNAVNPDIPGDANRDGKVDGSDVTILAGNWQHGVTGTANATWEMGDFNADGKVDGSDVTILAGNWQAGVEAATAAVPEPGTLALLLMAAFSLVLIRRKR